MGKQRKPPPDHAHTPLFIVPISPLLKQVQCKLVLGIDHPDEAQPLILQLGDGQALNVLVSELAVPQRNATGGVGRGKLPWWVHHDDVKLGGIVQAAPVIGHHVGVDWDALWWGLPFTGVYVLEHVFCVCCVGIGRAPHIKLYV